MEQKLKDEILHILELQHEAIDILFAMLIEKTNADFLPSESGKPWTACRKGNELIEKLSKTKTS